MGPGQLLEDLRTSGLCSQALAFKPHGKTTAGSEEVVEYMMSMPFHTPAPRSIPQELRMLPVGEGVGTLWHLGAGLTPRGVATPCNRPFFLRKPQSVMVRRRYQQTSTEGS